MALPRATKEQLADTSGYEYKSEEVDLPELGFSVEVRALSVEARDDLIDLMEKATKVKTTEESIKVTAEVFAVAVSDPEVTAEEAEAFIGKLPAVAADRVLKRFRVLVGLDTDEEEAAEKRREFRPQDD